MPQVINDPQAMPLPPMRYEAAPPPTYDTTVDHAAREVFHAVTPCCHKEFEATALFAHVDLNGTCPHDGRKINSRDITLVEESRVTAPAAKQIKSSGSIGSGLKVLARTVGWIASEIAGILLKVVSVALGILFRAALYTALAGTTVLGLATGNPILLASAVALALFTIKHG